MDMASLTQLISSFGFPVVACCLMGWYVKYTNDQHRTEVKELTDKHYDEMTTVRDALNNNTIAIQQLVALFSAKGVKWE